MISLIHPSRQRAQRAHDTVKKWLDNAGCEIEYILSLDVNDHTLQQYKDLFGPDTNILVNANRSAVDAINNASYVAKGNIFVVMSDDFDCPPLWGKQIIDSTLGLEDWIMKTPDGIQDWIITLPIMDRKYYERFGFIYFTEYSHMFCDTELSAVADMTGRKIDRNIPFNHLHYSKLGEQPDAVSRRADSTWEQGKKIFLDRFKTAFYLKETPGKITSESYWNWIKANV